MIQKAFQQLEYIEATSGTNDKMKLIEIAINDNFDFERFLRIAEEKDKYGIKAKTFENALGYNSKIHGKYYDAGMLCAKFARDNHDYKFEDVILFLRTAKDLSGLEQIEFLKRITTYDKSFAKWVARVLVNDLKIGVQLKTINKVLLKMKKPLIEKFQVQLCGKFKNIYEAYEKIPKGISGIKEDGIRVDVEKTGNTIDDIKFTSRAGEDIDYVPELKEHLLKTIPTNIHFDAEIMAKNFSVLQKRIGKKTENIEEVEGLKFCVFDIFSHGDRSFKDSIQKERHDYIKDLETNEMFKVEETIEYSTFEELKKFYDDAITRGCEGIVIKKPDSKYVYDSRNNWFKIKESYDCTMKIIGYEYGTGSNSNKISKLVVADSNNIVVSGVGSGLKKKDFEEILKLKELEDSGNSGAIIGLLIDINFEEITVNKDNKKSLRFPSVVKLRSDKIEADDLSELPLGRDLYKRKKTYIM